MSVNVVLALAGATFRSYFPFQELDGQYWVKDFCTALVIQAAHGQIDGSSRHPACLIGSHEDRHVSHLLECHKPSGVGLACEQLLELFPGHSRYLGASLEGFLERACLRYGLWSQTDHANALGRELGG